MRLTCPTARGEVSMPVTVKPKPVLLSRMSPLGYLRPRAKAHWRRLWPIVDAGVRRRNLVNLTRTEVLGFAALCELIVEAESFGGDLWDAAQDWAAQFFIPASAVRPHRNARKT